MATQTTTNIDLESGFENIRKDLLSTSTPITQIQIALKEPLDIILNLQSSETLSWVYFTNLSNSTLDIRNIRSSLIKKYLSAHQEFLLSNVLIQWLPCFSIEAISNYFDPYFIPDIIPNDILLLDFLQTTITSNLHFLTKTRHEYAISTIERLLENLCTKYSFLNLFAISHARNENHDQMKYSKCTACVELNNFFSFVFLFPSKLFYIFGFNVLFFFFFCLL